MAIITDVKARQIFDSRGNPTVEADVILENGIVGRSAVPSGASTGIHEAVELRDKDKKNYMGKSVLKAVKNVNTLIKPKITGMDPVQQIAIDQAMIKLDGTTNKGKLGANAILAVSMAAARAAADDCGLPLYQYLGGANVYKMPLPCFNILNGGEHADNNVDLQEFMIAPVGAPTFTKAMKYAMEVYHNLSSVLKSKKLNTSVGDEGGFAPNLSSNEEALKVIVQAVRKAGYKPGKDIAIVMDPAASSFYSGGKYNLKGEGKKLSAAQMVEFYGNFVKKYPIITIEDALAEDDWKGWKLLTDALGSKIQLVGDDLFVTNPKRLAMGIEKGVANAILIKLNQIGTVTETLQCIDLARSNNYTCMVSHRSGETADSFIADLVVATGAGQIKTGAPARSERLAKYNQLLRIEEELGKQAVYTGKLK